jgi:hypothetical protein
MQRQQTGFFDFMKNILPASENKPILYLKKVIYFPLSLELNSIK